ncbi:MAG: LysR family transcriptional regulator [Methyloceanibacter sp.]|jgi:DNA-binding transcriptional LysR family regulator
MDRLTAINVFVAIVEAGSLSAAGRRLGMPLTTVSRQLSALEEQVGVRLVTRTTRRLTLTEPGRDYLDSCRRIVAELEAAELRLAGGHLEPAGELALTAPIVFGRLHLLPIVTEFLATFPRVTARLFLVDRVVDLIEEGLDVSLRIGALPSSSLMAARVGSIRYVTCASPDYLARRGVPSLPQELARHDCISLTALSSAERWSFAGPKAQRQVLLHPRLTVNMAEAAIDAAVAGLGVARILSYQVTRHLADGSLRLILEAFEPEAMPISILHREDRLPQAKVQSFVGFAVPRLRAQMKVQSATGAMARGSEAQLPKGGASC